MPEMFCGRQFAGKVAWLVQFMQLQFDNLFPLFKNIYKRKS